MMKKSRWIRVRLPLTFLVAYVLGVGFGALISAITIPDNPALTPAKVAQHFGLENGKEYPLILNDYYTGSVAGTVSASTGLFSSRAVIDLQPTNIVSVGFNNGESWWQLALPSDITTFKKGGDAPTVSIWLERDTLPLGSYGTWHSTWGSCNWQLRNLWVVCTRPLLDQYFEMDRGTQARGLSGVIDKYLQGAEIRLTDEQYDTLFPTTN